MKIGLIFFLCLTTLVQAPGAAASTAADEWPALEEEMALQQRALDVNEGELQLLDKPPESASHYHQNRLLITEQSLADGWVTMYQCHSDLDKVSAAQIVYQKERIRGLDVLSSENIGSVRVEGHTIQMQDIEAESKVCISADKRALDYKDGLYILKLGPFMRRFLDGYYPMHVRVEVCFPPFLQLVKTSPVKSVQRRRGKNAFVEIDIWVVGELEIELVFSNR